MGSVSAARPVLELAARPASRRVWRSRRSGSPVRWVSSWPGFMWYAWTVRVCYGDGFVAGGRSRLPVW